MRPTLLAALAACYLFALVDLTLVRFPQPAPTPNLVPLRTIAACCAIGGRTMAVNVLGNLLLMAPVGVLLPLARPGRVGALGVLLAGGLLSGLIESAQYACGHRMADVDDLLLNAAGALAGYAMLLLSVAAARSGRVLEHRLRHIGPDRAARWRPATARDAR